MTVYVDDMYRYPIGQFGRMKMSHLVADTRDELFACVDAIGVKRKWIQHFQTSGEHFDIAISKRLTAVTWGAVPITYRVLSLMCARRQAEGVLGKPDEIEAWFDAHCAEKRIARFPAPEGAPKVVVESTPGGASWPRDLFNNEGRPQ